MFTGPSVTFTKNQSEKVAICVNANYGLGAIPFVNVYK